MSAPSEFPAGNESESPTLANTASDNGPQPVLTFLSSPMQPDELGRLGPYRIIAVLGQGGMGVVLHAEDERLHRSVALKVMLPEVSRQPAARERFLREAQSAAQLEHDHIVPIYDVGEHNGVPFLAMPLLQGKPLADLLQHRRLSAPQVIRLGKQIALGLQAAHERALIHRDIKPANLWLEPVQGGRIRILDFGLARLLNEDTKLTGTGAFLGTPSYVSPEQGRGEIVGTRSDLFSLGVVLYRMCSGTLPFQGSNTMAILTELATKDPQPIQKLNRALPEPLCALIMQLLAKKPEDRPANAAEVAQRLARMETGGNDTNAIPVATAVAQSVPEMPTQSYVGDSDLPIPAGTVVHAPAPESLKKRPRWLVLTAGLALVSVVIAGIIASIGDNDEKDIDSPKLRPADRVKVQTAKEKDNNPGKKEATDPSVTRRVAQWVLSKHGEVHTHLAPSKPIRREQDLPRGDFRIIGVNLRNAAPLYEKDLARLTELSSLQSLVLPASISVSTYRLQQLSKIKNLTELTVSGSFTGAPQRLAPKLTHFSVVGPGSGIGVLEMRSIAKLRNLTHLRLSNREIARAGLAELPPLTQLTHLDLSGTHVDYLDLRPLSELKNLESLNLQHTKGSDSVLYRLAGLTHLRELRLGNTSIQGKGLQNLRALKQLTTLDMTMTRTDDEALVHLKELPGLKHLILDHTNVTDAGIKSLQSLKGLETLKLNDTGITAQGAEKLRKTFSPEIVAWTPRGSSDRRAAEWVCSIGGRLWCAPDSRNWQRFVQETTHLPKGVFSIKQIDLGMNQKISRTMVHALTGLQRLKTLTLWEAKGIGTEEMRCIGTLTSLTRLHLDKLPIGDQELQHLKGLKNLQGLTLTGTNVTEQGAKELKRALPDCAIVWAKQPDNDREVAMWLLSQKVVPQISYWGSGSGQALSSPSDLPLSRFFLYSATFTRPEDREALRKLQLVSNLDSLTVRGEWVTDATLQYLTFHRRLSYLYLHRTSVQGSGLKHLPEKSRLSRLELSESPVTDEGLAHLQRLTELKNIDLSGTKITGEGLKHLKGLKVSALELQSTAVDDAALAHLKEMRELTSLALGGTRVTGEGLKHLAGMSLYSLNLSGTQVTDAGLQHLTKVAKVGRLYLPYTRITDAGLEALANVPGLEELNLFSTRVSALGIQKLNKARPELTTHWSEPNRTLAEGILKEKGKVWIKVPGKDDVVQVTKPDDLPPVLFQVRAVTLTDVSRFSRQSPLTQLKYLTDPEFDALKKLTLEGDRRYGSPQSLKLELLTVPTLEELSLKWIEPVVSEKMTWPQLPRLRVLRLDECKVSDEVLQALDQLKSLKELSLAWVKLTDDDLKWIGQLSELETLMLTKCAMITDKGLTHLRSLKKLRKLDVRATRVTDAGLAELRKALPNLQKDGAR